MESGTAALADSSWFNAREERHPLRPHPGELVVSIVTIAELRFGVLATSDPEARARQLSTLLYAESLTLLPIDRAVAEAWAQLMERLRETGRELAYNASWIAATALAHRLPIVSRDAAYDDLPGLHVIRV